MNDATQTTEAPAGAPRDIPPVPVRFDPATHYWQIAGNPKVFKAATNVLVLTSDSGYTAWLNAGNRTTPIGSEIELWTVMRNFLPDMYPEWLFNGTTFIQPAPGNFTTAQLRAYAAQIRWETEIGNISFTPRGGPSQGVVLVLDTTREAQAAINAAAVAAEKTPTYSTQWKTVDNVFHPVDAATVVLMGGSVQLHVQRCYIGEQACQSYTTLSQIDEEFMAIAQMAYPDPSQP